MKFNLCNGKSWKDTENVLVTTLCTQFGWSKDQFAHNIEQPHLGNYKNPNSPIYAKFLSGKVAYGILESIIKANSEGKSPYLQAKSILKRCKIKWICYFWKENNSKKMKSEKHGRGMLNLKEPTDEKHKVFDCDSWNTL